ncbi:MAG: DUF5652 family protein [Candidatus Pacearchaeota archaeon]
MGDITTILGIPIWLFLLIAVWELIWKGIALWKTGRNNQLVWFVFILILNTIGILPIVYLLFFQKRKVAATSLVKAPKKAKRRK